jgi:predicted regulator of Ras-like GTPase activity (Roadblock/LC7/MglB family)
LDKTPNFFPKICWRASCFLKGIMGTMKIKFAGLLRGLLRQLDDRDASPARPVVTAQPVPATSKTNPAPAPKNKNVPAFDTAKIQNGIELPLAPIVAALPMDLRAKIISVPTKEAKIILPVEKVTSQLAFGAVKISFGELRQLAPGIFANAGSENDQRAIHLPLQEIIARLNPDLLARRPVQKIEVTEEISGPFGARAGGVSFTTQPLKSTETPTSEFPKRNVTSSLPNSFASENPRATTPGYSFNPPPTKSTNGNGSNGHANGNDHSTVPAVPFKFSAAPVPTTPNSTTSRPESVQPTISLVINDLAETWPQELKEEIAQAGISHANVALPVAHLEPGLKRGRVTMTWMQLRLLASPNSAASRNDELILDLPLKIIAPAFLAAQKNLARPARLIVPEEIPNLFFGFPQPIEKTPTLKLSEQKVLDTNYFNPKDEALKSSETDFHRVQNPATDFLNRHMPPKEVVAQAVAFPGVAGAIIALPDGLRVASETPADLNAETLAAFLPQIFDRVSQSTRELRMGSVNNVGFTVGNITWKIFRVNAIYFAAFGRAGENLPTAQLASLAAQLDRKQY